MIGVFSSFDSFFSFFFLYLLYDPKMCMAFSGGLLSIVFGSKVSWILLFPSFSILNLLGVKSRLSSISSFEGCSRSGILFIIVRARHLQCQCQLSFAM